jgi:flavin reductase (DIM6/NTAB) family NADH-FMN oxidoreductase RutF
VYASSCAKDATRPSRQPAAESGNGYVALQAKEFRDALGLFATGVAVIATEIEGRVHAMTANAVSSLSLDPMLVLFCPAKKARFSQLLPAATHYSINFLRDDQQALSTFFAGGWKDSVPPPFRFVASGRFRRREGALSSLLCIPHQVLDGGDHWLVTARVEDAYGGIAPHRPLLFFRGQYRVIDSSAGTPAPDLVATSDEPPQMYYHD